jgi:hypothetical protein
MPNEVGEILIPYKKGHEKLFNTLDEMIRR